MNNYLDREFFNLSQKRRVLENLSDDIENETVDLEGFFLEEDRYYGDFTPEEKLFRAEFRKIPKSNDAMARIEELEVYNKEIDKKLIKSATKNYDKFRNLFSCLISISIL